MLPHLAEGFEPVSPVSKVAIIGTGLIGGSLSIALRNAAVAKHVACYDTSPEVRDAVRVMRIADSVSDSAGEAVSDAEIVFIAVPNGSIVDCFQEIRGKLSPGCVVSDLGSVKEEVVRTVERLSPEGVRYVGAHPMAGSEQSGVRSARPGLFRDALIILTPTPHTDPDAIRCLTDLFRRIEARVTRIDPVVHDRAMAAISHLPHMLSVLLMKLADDQSEEMPLLYEVAAGGFRDMTRVAASNVDVWTDIASANRSFIIERLNAFSGSLNLLVDVLEREDLSSLSTILEEARDARTQLSIKSGLIDEEVFEVSLQIPNEPGVISRITAIVASEGVNIENMEITHPTEGETGIMAIKIIEEGKAALACERLCSAGYRASYWRAR